MPALSEEGDEGLLLLHAAKDGDCTRLRELVMIYGISVDFEEEGSGVTALCVSADGGHESAVSLLITLGANVNKTFGSSCSTPAHLAAKNGHVSVLKILGKAGADFAARNKSGDTFFLQACAAGQEEVVHWVLGLEAGLRKLLHESCGGFGTSPLMAAAAGGHLGVLRILLAGDEGKASVCLTDSAGNTALHMAARGSSCVQSLIEAGALINCANKAGKTAYAIAKAHGDADSVAHMDARLKELEALADAAARSLEEEDSFNQGPKSLSTTTRKKKKGKKAQDSQLDNTQEGAGGEDLRAELAGPVETSHVVHISAAVQHCPESKNVMDSSTKRTGPSGCYKSEPPSAVRGSLNDTSLHQPKVKGGAQAPSREVPNLQAGRIEADGEHGEDVQGHLDDGAWAVIRGKTKGRSKQVGEGDRSRASAALKAQAARKEEKVAPPKTLSPKQVDEQVVPTSASGAEREATFTGAPVRPTWASRVWLNSVDGDGEDEGDLHKSVSGGYAEIHLQVIEERLRSSFPTASALALEPRHVLGIGVEELSVSQLEALEEVHRTLMMKAGEMRVELAVRNERARMEEMMEERLRMQAALLQNP